MASDGKFYWKWNAGDSRPTTLNVDQWFETGVNDHVHRETHLPAPAEVLIESKKEDHSNGTRPPGRKANSVAPNTNTNNIDDTTMLDSSDDEDEVEYEMSDEQYDLYYHDEMYVEYNSHPIPKKVYVHNQDLSPVTLLVCDTIQNQSSRASFGYITRWWKQW